MSTIEYQKQDFHIYIVAPRNEQEQSTIELLFTGIHGSLMNLFWLIASPILLCVLIFLIIAYLRLRISDGKFRSNFWQDLYDRREVY